MYAIQYDIDVVEDLDLQMYVYVPSSEQSLPKHDA